MRPVVTATADRAGLRPVAKAFRLRFLHHIDARMRQAGAVREFLHHPHQLGRGGKVDLLRAMSGERQPVRVPVGEEVRHDGEAERDQHAGLAAEQKAHRAEKGGEGSKKQACADQVHVVGSGGPARFAAPEA